MTGHYHTLCNDVSLKRKVLSNDGSLLYVGYLGRSQPLVERGGTKYMSVITFNFNIWFTTVKASVLHGVAIAIAL